MFADAVMVALPAVASILLVNLAFGVVSRSAPQLNIFGVGFPITLTLGFVILVFAIANWGTRMFADAIMVALPAVASILLVNLAFGVVSRSAPQLNIFGVGFPVTLTLGFVILVFAVANLLPQMQQLIDGAFTSLGQFGNGGR